MNKSAKVLWPIGLLAIVVLLSGCTLFGDGKDNGNKADNTNQAVADETAEPDEENITPAELVGTWKSDCLVPDQDSPWAEMHQFEITTDGWADHTRWNWGAPGCTGTGEALVDHYLISFPAAGQIDLVNMGEGISIYDIYDLSGLTLVFGHGFRNNLTYSSTTGDSPTTRISTVNQYIKYQKIN